MTYSPYGDRDSGGTRTNVDTEVHEHHDEEDRANDGDANAHDVNGHDGAATPFQRESNEDETVVDQDVVEDVDGRDRPETVDAESDETPGGVQTEHDVHDAETRADDAVPTETEAVTADDADGHVRTDETAPADETMPADQTMPADEMMPAGEMMPAHDVAADTGAPTDVDAPEHAGGEPVDATHGDEADAHATETPSTPPSVDADPTAAGAGADTYVDGTDADRAVDGTFAGVQADAASAPYGDAPMAGAVETDYVAVGVAEPLTESEAEDIADADRPGATSDVGDDAVPLAAAAAAAADGPAVGMMPGDAPVVDAARPMPNADATHDRWQQIQLGFIDDPRGSVESARSLVVEAVEARISALRDRQTALDGWRSEATPDTEVLRAAIQGYRDMLNSLNDTP